jgi:hypothetical protein
MSQLWDHYPLVSMQNYLAQTPPAGGISVVEQSGGMDSPHWCARQLCLMAQLDIPMLRPEALRQHPKPGSTDRPCS